MSPFSRILLQCRQVHIRRAHTLAAPNPLTLQIWGANTGVGKTVFSAGLLRVAGSPSLYLKPVQTGYPTDDDSGAVRRHASKINTLTLYSYEKPVSPDLAANLESHQPVCDTELCSHTERVINEYRTSVSAEGQSNPIVALVETAGGVLSPCPSGTSQADVYRPLRLPAVLIGDANLGGISTTLAAYEALMLRGYQVPALVLFEEQSGQLDNESSIQEKVRMETSVFRAPKLPPPDISLQEYFNDDNVNQFFAQILRHLHRSEEHRLKAIEKMDAESREVFWYPFTQHTQLQDIISIDSAYGNDFMIYNAGKGFHPITDASGSWWTNGLGHGDVGLAKAIGAAAGRYGHVMFAECTYEPAFALAKSILNGPGAGWASRAFYSDDGSTAMEVALKMAFRKRAVDVPQRKGLPVKIVGLHGSYHGDTLGVMNCSADSDFNRLQTPWYKSCGFHFDPPCASIKDGIWTIKMPSWVQTDDEILLTGREELFSTERSVKAYEDQIGLKLDQFLEQGDADIGALVIEPILMGAGGMKIVDPAFQRALVDECRKRQIPVVFDEIFVGLWRLGVESAGKLLGRDPDISAFGKLLTGGSVPLSMTIARKEVFKAFEGASKKEALLHGHSYTAHAIGCAAGVESMERFEVLREQGPGRLTYWDEGIAREISSFEFVKGVSVVGTVMSVEFNAKNGEGYSATGALQISRRLKDEGIFARPLGNVIYMMCTPLSGREHCEALSKRLFRVFDKYQHEASGPESKEESVSAS
ncbi:Dethiobiotin synthase [Gracilaria domingensis]|nr:Dethiobiotin synthase [Gracilaria domingensis]